MRNTYWLTCSAAAMCLLAVVRPASAAKTFYIDQCMDYAGGSCGGISTPEETALLRDYMVAEGWTGSRYADTAAYPQDFREQCSSSYGSGGLDGVYADTKGVVVFSGHGGPGGLHFSRAHDGECGYSFDGNGRLGSMSGAQATVGMWLACRVHQDVSGFGYQWLRQSLAFMGDIWLGANDAANVYFWTGNVCLPAPLGGCGTVIPGMSNATAWLEVMNSGERHPIAVTMSNYSVDDCWNVHNSAKMRNDVYNYPRGGGPSCDQGQPLYYWCAQWY